MLDNIEQLTGQFVGLVWGLPLVALLVGSGIFFTIYFGFPQITFFKHSIQIISGKYDNPNDAGEISHFQALCAALSRHRRRQGAAPGEDRPRGRLPIAERGRDRGRGRAIALTRSRGPYRRSA